MIVEISYKYSANKNEWLEQNGYAQNEWDSKKYIGPIKNVPVEVLNNKESFYVSFFNNNQDEFSSVSTLLAMAENFKKSDFTKAIQEETPIHIHIPSPELSFFNKVDWIEDACTNELQKMLDDGFRIIACIPRVGQRRPDYVLGKRV